MEKYKFQAKSEDGLLEKALNELNVKEEDVITKTYEEKGGLFSGKKYTLTVQELEQQTISEKRYGSDRWFYPTHFTAMSYTLSPEPDSDVTICDCAEGDKPLEIAPCSDRYAPEARNDIACIGIIGGADGPIAIVCRDSSKEKLHAVCSSLHFEPVEGDIEWRIVFNIKSSNEMSLGLI